MITIINSNHPEFVETDCKIKFQNYEISANGSWLLKNEKTNLLEGMLYLVSKKHNTTINYFVTTWDNSQQWHAVLMNRWRSNFGDIRQSFFLIINGIKFYGLNAGNNDIVRIKQYKNQSA